MRSLQDAHAALRKARGRDGEPGAVRRPAGRRGGRARPAVRRDRPAPGAAGGVGADRRRRRPRAVRDDLRGGAGRAGGGGQAAVGVLRAARLGRDRGAGAGARRLAGSRRRCPCSTSSAATSAPRWTATPTPTSASARRWPRTRSRSRPTSGFGSLEPALSAAARRRARRVRAGPDVQPGGRARCSCADWAGRSVAQRVVDGGRRCNAGAEPLGRRRGGASARPRDARAGPARAQRRRCSPRAGRAGRRVPRDLALRGSSRGGVLPRRARCCPRTGPSRSAILGGLARPGRLRDERPAARGRAVRWRVTADRAGEGAPGRADASGAGLRGSGIGPPHLMTDARSCRETCAASDLRRCRELRRHGLPTRGLTPAALRSLRAS